MFERAKFETVIRYGSTLTYKTPPISNLFKSSEMSSCYDPSLKQLTNDDVQRFTLKGTERYAKVVSVYDGDTCDLVFYQSNEMENHFRFKCRMSDYNAPELDEEPSGEMPDYLTHLCMGGDSDVHGFSNPEVIWTKEELQQELVDNERLVYAVFGRDGKYGRPLATLYQTSSTGDPPEVENSINDMMEQFIHELDCKFPS